MVNLWLHEPGAQRNRSGYQSKSINEIRMIAESVGTTEGLDRPKLS